MIADYHIHLRGPSDGHEGAPEFTVAAVERFSDVAAERGIDEIGFTEHLYYFREFAGLLDHPYQEGRTSYELDAYCTAIDEAKCRGLPVKLGLEVEYLPGTEEQMRSILDRYPWDFLLGSVHLIDGEAVDMQPGIWANLEPAEVWRRYFDLLCELAESELVDVLAHPDLVKIFGNGIGPSELGEVYEAAAETIAGAGVAIEISTAGLRKPVGEIYPAIDLLTTFRSRDVPITLASDAHAAQFVGRDFDQAIAYAKRVGYGTVTVFGERRAQQEALG